MLKKIKLIGEQKKVLFLPPTNPIQIKGVAGSGKTTVALYRAKHLMETQAHLFNETRIVIFTFNKTLTAYIEAICPYIGGGYQKDDDKIIPKTSEGLRVKIINFHKWAYRFADIKPGQTIQQWEQRDILESILNNFNANSSKKITKNIEFFKEEISWMKGKLFQIKDDYIEAKRIGRGTSDRVTLKDKESIWEIFNTYNQRLAQLDKVDFDDYAIMALDKIKSDTTFYPPFTHIIIDEAQDLNKAQILTISKLVSKDTNSISIIADAAQRIYKSGFTWSEVGINVRGGRTIEFKKNYRNSIHIALVALSLLENEKDKSEFTEIETALEGGGKPKVGYFASVNKQKNQLLIELEQLRKKASLKNTIILHRTNEGVNEIKAFLEMKGFYTELVKSNNAVNYDNDKIKLCTMSSVKGLEFNNVFVIDLNESILPSPLGFLDSDDEFHISTERRLLYTCITRARNNLFLFSYGKPSRFLHEIDHSLLEEIS